MANRLRTSVTFLVCLVWTTVGFALPAILLPEATQPAPLDLMLALGCMALALAFSLVRVEFRHLGQRLELAPVAGFVTLTAIVVSPAWAALVGGVAVVHQIRRSGTLLERVFLAAGGSIGAATASVAAHAVSPGTPVGRAVLGAAIAAAVTRSLVALTGQLLLAESRAPGGAYAVLRHMPVGPILILEAGLPIAAVCVAGPFLDEPPLALIVLIAAQLLTWLILRLLQQQHHGRRINARLLDTFHRYVPAHVAREVLSSKRGQSGAVASLDGELREITVMFIDIRGFTSWAERTQPADVLNDLNDLLGDLAEAILSTDGTIDKFTGDGLMAFWNAPIGQTDHAARAVKSLPRILMRVRETGIRREVQRSTPLEVGIGIATGPAMVGNVGHRERLAYTAVGDTVNLAARLEKATRDQDVPALIAESTFLSLPHQLQRQLTRLASLELKGREARVRVFAPTALVKHRKPMVERSAPGDEDHDATPLSPPALKPLVSNSDAA